jgi:hypothetical protein
VLVQVGEIFDLDAAFKKSAEKGEKKLLSDDGNNDSVLSYDLDLAEGLSKRLAQHPYNCQHVQCSMFHCFHSLSASFCFRSVKQKVPADDDDTEVELAQVRQFTSLMWQVV